LRGVLDATRSDAIRGRHSGARPLKLRIETAGPWTYSLCVVFDEIGRMPTFPPYQVPWLLRERTADEHFAGALIDLVAVLPPR